MKVALSPPGGRLYSHHQPLILAAETIGRTPVWIKRGRNMKSGAEGRLHEDAARAVLVMQKSIVGIQGYQMTAKEDQ